MFEGLSQRLQEAFQKLKRKGKLTEADVKAALREVRLALLEADVNYRVVKDFLGRVQERAVGEEVMKSLTPAQQVVKIVREELVALMDGERDLRLKGDPSVVLLVGLQGSGKTTTAAKLGLRLKGEGYRPFLVPADPYRPAAGEQLRRLAERADLPCFTPQDGQGAVERVLLAREEASRGGYGPLIVDTAGRLHIDDALMEELAQLKAAVTPSEVLLVADAMTGQDAVNVAKGFEERLGITGVILTKLDGDARGGAALSIKAVTGKPIKFVGVGEGLHALEPFYADRMASRILGMGDVLTLIERAEAALEKERARELEEKFRREEFDLEDFREQLRQLRRMGPLDELLKMLPGVPGLKGLGGLKMDERQIVRMEAIINSMTPEERRRPQIINGSRRRRIAKGSGTTVQEVNRLLKQFQMTRKMLKQMKRARGRRWVGLLQ